MSTEERILVIRISVAPEEGAILFRAPCPLMKTIGPEFPGSLSSAFVQKQKFKFHYVLKYEFHVIEL